MDGTPRKNKKPDNAYWRAAIAASTWGNSAEESAHSPIHAGTKNAPPHSRRKSASKTAPRQTAADAQTSRRSSSDMARDRASTIPESRSGTHAAKNTPRST